MSPIPLIQRQRALSRIGEIRCGDEKHDGKVGRKLETFRLTSQHEEILARAAELYGGLVKEWDSPTGAAWQLITTRSSLPVLVIPGYSLKRSYEMWAGPSKRERVCDGEELSTGEPCTCNAQGRDECKLLTRLMVLLPETGSSLGWQLSSTGETAADELDLAMKIAEGIAYGRPFVPGTLSLTQRKGQLNGKATRFVVPVLGFDPIQPVAGQILGGETSRELTALPAGYTPIPERAGNGASLAEGLATAETQTLTKPPRVPLPDDDVEDEEPGASLPHPAAKPAAQEASPATTGNTIAASTRDKPATKAQRDKLNVLVGALRERQVIATHDLWNALAKTRRVDIDTLFDLYNDAYTPDGVLHWSPLRDSLTRAEAHDLIDRLEALEKKVAA